MQVILSVPEPLPYPLSCFPCARLVFLSSNVRLPWLHPNHRPIKKNINKGTKLRVMLTKKLNKRICSNTLWGLLTSQIFLVISSVVDEKNQEQSWFFRARLNLTAAGSNRNLKPCGFGRHIQASFKSRYLIGNFCIRFENKTAKRANSVHILGLLVR